MPRPPKGSLKQREAWRRGHTLVQRGGMRTAVSAEFMNNENILNRRRIFTSQEKAWVLEKTGGRCARCGKSVNDIAMTVDHIWPVSKGGLNDEFNLAPLCEACNLDKSDSILPVSWYRFILEPYRNAFSSYNAYAMKMNGAETIMQSEYVEYKGVTSQVAAMAARNPRKARMLYNLGVGKARLTRAFPGEAGRIYEFVKKCDSRSYLLTTGHYYDNEYSVYDDICGGEVYVLETKSEICGVFSFRKANDDLLDYPQIKNIAENYNLNIHMVMVAAIGNKVGMAYFNEVMEDFFGWQVERRWLPLYFNVLVTSLRTEIYEKQVIRMPYNLNGHNGNIEVNQTSYYRDWIRDFAESAIRKHSREYSWDATEEDIEKFSELIMMKRGRAELDDDEREFLETRPHLIKYFMPESMDIYNDGFEWRNRVEEDSKEAAEGVM